MHLHVNNMAHYNVEHLHYITRSVCVTERDRAIIIISINSNPPRWIVIDSNREHEYKSVISERWHDWGGRVLRVVYAEAEETVEHRAYIIQHNITR
jgi:hypothetical protein